MTRILHLGVGNFHRAHQAWYTHEANRLAGEDWRITGVSLRSPRMRDALRPQGFAYTLAVSDRAGERLHRIGVLDHMLVAPEDAEAVIAALADPDVAVITLTVTEKGYHLGSDGRMRNDAPAIAADLDALTAGRHPTSTIGLLAAGLARRAATGAPVTVMSCDNLPENGPRLAAAVRAFAAAGWDVADYLDRAVAFPASMVDRITPATDDTLRARIADTDLPPAEPVATEAFSEWVVEDAFAAARPAWEEAGAVLTEDVRPYELRKLRMLNGAHSYLAYAGTLAGHGFVHEAIADPALREGALALMDEAAATLPDIVRADARAYARALVARFENPHLQHRLRQIAMDGSQKLPIRILGTLRDRKARGMASPACEATLDAWAGFLAAEMEAGRVVDDPDADRLAAGLADGASPRELLEHAAGTS